MKFLTPIAMTDAQLVSTSATESAAAYNPATTYAADAIVRSDTTHRRYRSVQAGNTGNALTDNTDWWLDIGPTNDWAMFDQAVGTITTGTDPIVVVIEPAETFNGMALLDLVAESVQVEVVVDAVTIYDKTFNMADYRVTFGWYEWFFEPLSPQMSLVIDDLPPTGEITITINGTACGTLAIGRIFDVGRTLAKPRLGIIDYSVKETDQFGATTVVQRDYAKTFDVDVLVDGRRVDGVAARLAQERATPVIWIGDDQQKYQSLLAYGFYKDWDVVIEYPTHSLCRITIEGLT